MMIFIFILALPDEATLPLSLPKVPSVLTSTENICIGSKQMSSQSRTVQITKNANNHSLGKSRAQILENSNQDSNLNNFGFEYEIQITFFVKLIRFST